MSLRARGHQRIREGRWAVQGPLGPLPSEARSSPRTGDHIVMVNGVSMESVNSAFAIQILKTCAKMANVVSGAAWEGTPAPGRAPLVLRPTGGRVWAGASGIPFPFHSLDTEAQRGRGPPGPPSGRDRALSWLPLCLPRQTVKRPRKIRLPAPKASPCAPGRQDSDEEDGPWRLEEADHGRGYEGDTSSGSGRSSGERSHRPRAGRRSRASSRGRRSPGGGSEANGLALVSGFKRLPRQDVRMRPVKSVLVRRRESEGEPDGSGARRPAAGPPRTPGRPAPRGVWAAGPADMSLHAAKGTLQIGLSQGP